MVMGKYADGGHRDAELTTGGSDGEEAGAE